MITPITPKGFRDFLPEEALVRRFVINEIKNIFERFGFDPLETPALEYADTLLGKYGNEADKLLYLFEDRGGRKVGLRYDQTVPLARVVAQYGQALSTPFKRYQIQPVWRAENPQKGRFREFLQCDIDTVGSNSPLADAEIIAVSLTVLKNLGFKNPLILINDRQVFDNLGLSKKEIIILDKLDKIGQDAVIKELENAGTQKPEELLTLLRESMATERLAKIFTSLKEQGFVVGTDFRFDPFLARGLDYYTSTIFEIKLPDYKAGSVGGGGRYDKLIGSFLGQDAKDIPAVGLAFGFDRIVEALLEAKLIPSTKTATQVLVTVFTPALINNALEITTRLRNSGINTEVYFDENSKLEKQLKFADKKGIPYVIIQGPDEVSRNVLKFKNMTTQEQKELTIEQVIDEFKIT